MLDKGASIDDTSPRIDTVSSLVRHLEQTIPEGEDITVGTFLSLLGVYGFVFFILVLGILNIAIFMMPGLSILFGIPMVIMVVQMLLGHKAPVFPDYIRSKTIKSDLLRRGLSVSEKALQKIEVGVRPRLTFLTHPAVNRVHHLVALILALMVAIPIPFINIPPTIGIVLLAIGLMQRDGYFIVGAYLFGFWSFWLYESLGSAAQSLLH